MVNRRGLAARIHSLSCDSRNDGNDPVGGGAFQVCLLEQKPRNHAVDDTHLMGITDKMWDAITTVIKMNDKVERLAVTVKYQQDKIENLTERIIRLETALEIGLAKRTAGHRRLELKDRG